MKYILMVITIGLVMTACKTKSLYEIEKQLHIMLNPRSLAYDTLGFASLSKHDNFCSRGNEHPWDFYHVADLNRDGHPDLLYSGPCMPYSQTKVYLNNGLQLEEVYNYPGNINFLEHQPDKTVVYIFNEATGCSYYSSLTIMTIYNDSRVEFRSIFFNWATDVVVDNLAVVKVSGILRTSMVIDDKKTTDECSNKTIVGNHLEYISQLTDVVQLKRKGPWRLVLYPVNKDRSVIGWIKEE